MKISIHKVFIIVYYILFTIILKGKLILRHMVLFVYKKI